MGRSCEEREKGNWVYLRTGPDVPEPRVLSMFTFYTANPSMSMTEFQRVFGLKLELGIHGIEVGFAVTKKTRRVTEVVIEPVERKHYRLEVEDA